MNKEIENKVEEIVSDFLWKINNQENRDKIAERLSEALGFQFKDESQPTMIDNDFISFHGFNPEIKKITIITIAQG